ncbi:pyridoxamine 5'-phosphate oxidase family protein [uncultured Psychroserpens sp.]|uniref:pyridoxamine 5'-phosphate oxidase family protein n=1 Tax=uncultured Psychroserpens sp. TaxID=255436 RepID=UPI00260D67BE|nr:pyridoxamine 5'-phosphate oxidase family protein [uncultured Psychroserpens sp.]
MIRTLKHKECIHILTNNYIGHLAYTYMNKPFVVPVTYFFDEKINAIIGYSAEGHKVKAMRKKPSVCMEVSEIDSVNVWDSVLIHGQYEELEGSNAKAHLHDFSLGVKDLIIRKEHRKLDFISQFSSKIFKDDFPIIFLIKIEEITGKMRRHESTI